MESRFLAAVCAVSQRSPTPLSTQLLSSECSADSLLEARCDARGKDASAEVPQKLALLLTVALLALCRIPDIPLLSAQEPVFEAPCDNADLSG